jgi:O-antigen ligase
MTVLVVGGVAVLFAIALAVGIYRWQWSIYGLIAYIPVSGIPITAAYGHRLERAAAVSGKDFLFVLPAYVGFVVWAIRRRKDPRFPGAPVLLYAALAIVVLAQAFNPSVPKPLVALIGVKVWLFYVPLLLLGYHLVGNRAQLRWLLTLVALSAVLPAAIGVIEALLVYSGHDHFVYSLYGRAAGAVTQQFAQFEIGRGLRRIPSTFSSVTQFFIFSSVMASFVYAWWRSGPARGRLLSVPPLLWLLVLAAVVLSGQRSAWVFLPLLVILILALDFEARLAVKVVPVLAALLGAVVLVLGASVPSVYHEVKRTFDSEVKPVVVDPTRYAIHRTTFGVGTGVDTVSARYAYPNQSAWNHSVESVIGGWRENWYVRAYLELGVIGFVIVVALLATMAVRGARAYRRVDDPALRSVAAALLALVLWPLVYDVKSPMIDFDPLNVYYWLGLGILLRLPSLAAAAPEPAVPVEARPVEAAPVLVQAKPPR